MCVISMVMDHYKPLVPKTITWPSNVTISSPEAIALGLQVAELKKVIADFKEAVAAAKKVDALTGQPDCVDPEKAKLEDRVVQLEQAIKKLEHRRARARRRG